jgi:hypothetical protein
MRLTCCRFKKNYEYEIDSNEKICILIEKIKAINTDYLVLSGKYCVFTNVGSNPKYDSI